MSSSKSHRDSVAWQKSMRLIAAVYAATRCFPKQEVFGLTNQLRRAAISIPSNIAEGRGRTTRGEVIQFLGMARGSALEVQTQLEIAVMLGLGNRHELESAVLLTEEIVRMLNSSIVTLRSNAATRK